MFVNSFPCLGTVSIDSFQTPSTFCVSASRRAGGCEYGRNSIARTVGSESFATSAAERYLMGPDALSRIHPSGKVIVSPAPGGGGSVISAAELGRVTIGARRLLALIKSSGRRSGCQKRERGKACGKSIFCCCRWGAGCQ